MTTANDITGDLLKTKTTTEQYRDGWDRIFGKKGHITPVDGNVFSDLGFPKEEAEELLRQADDKIKKEHESRDSNAST